MNKKTKDTRRKSLFILYITEGKMSNLLLLQAIYTYDFAMWLNF